jgi:hypothetical protein
VEPAPLQPRERSFAAAFSDPVQVRAGSTAYFRVTASSSGAISVTGPEGAALPAHMRVWVVRLQ